MIAFSQKEKSSKKKLLSTKKIIVAFSSLIGFVISAFGTWGLYFYSHISTICTTIPNNVNLPICTISNDDFPFAVMQIIGLFIPVSITLWTTNFKKEEEKMKETSKDQN